MEPIKYLLAENQMPTAWYNIRPALPTQLPPVLRQGKLIAKAPQPG